jgi:hypothetical protein
MRVRFSKKKKKKERTKRKGRRRNMRVSFSILHHASKWGFMLHPLG